MRSSRRGSTVYIGSRMGSRNIGANFSIPANAVTNANTWGIPWGGNRIWDGPGGGNHWAALDSTVARTYSWSAFDAAIVTASSGWITTFTVGYTPTWDNAAANNNTYPNPYPPATNANYFNFITDLISRAAGKLYGIEVWNEVNDSTGYWNGTQAQLITLTQNVQTQCHAAGMLVLSPSCTYPPAGCPYAIQMLTQGLATYADIFTAHIYPHDYPDPGSGITGHGLAEQVWQQAHWWIATGDAGGMQGKPVWINEGGWLQATTITQAANRTIWAALWPILIHSAGCAFSAWYSPDDSTVGTLETTGTLSTQGVAYKTAVNWLYGSRWISRAARVYGTNAISNTAGTGVGNGNTTAPTNWFVNNPDSTHNVTHQFLGTGTENGMSYLKWRAFTTAAVSSGASGAIQLFPVPSMVASGNNAWWCFEAFMALDAATSMTNGVPNGARDILMNVQDNGYSNIASSSQYVCKSAIDKSKKIVWGKTAASGTTGVQPYFIITYNVGVTFDITLRIGIGSTPGTDGAATCDQATVWSADIARPGGFQGRIRWDMAGGPTTYTPPSPYNAFKTDLTGTKTAISTTVSLTNQPLLLANM